MISCETTIITALTHLNSVFRAKSQKMQYLCVLCQRLKVFRANLAPLQKNIKRTG